MRPMPKVSVIKETQKSSKEAFSLVRGFLDNDRDLKKLDPAYACTFDESNLSGTATGKMFKAHMTVKSAGSGSKVEIVVDLPLALALAKGVVQKTLQKKLDETLT